MEEVRWSRACGTRGCVTRCWPTVAWMTSCFATCLTRTWPGACSRMLLAAVHARWARLWSEDDRRRTQFRCCCRDALCRTVSSRWSRTRRGVFFRPRRPNWAAEWLLLAAVGVASYTPKRAVCRPVRLNGWSVFAVAWTENSGRRTRSRSATVLQPRTFHWGHISWSRFGHQGTGGPLQTRLNYSFQQLHCFDTCISLWLTIFFAIEFVCCSVSEAFSCNDSQV